MKNKSLISLIFILTLIFQFSIPGIQVTANEDLENENLEKENTYSEEANNELDLEEQDQEDVKEIKNEDGKKDPTVEAETQELNENDIESETEEDSPEESSHEESAETNLEEVEEIEEIEEVETQDINVYSVGIDLPYKKGDNHDDIIPVKEKLNALGFDGIATNSGNFGSHTERRVKGFQEYYGLDVTGEVDQATLDKLEEVYGNPYQNGRTNDYTTEMKVMLNALGYSGLAEGPVFGNLTEKRVTEFQDDYGLKAHGIADDPTIATLSNAYNNLNSNEFKRGDEHAIVTEIKVKLNRLGYSGLAEGPVFGSLTETRVREFQKYYGISITGVADEQTQNKLDEIYNSPYQRGNSNSYTTEVKVKLNGLGYDGLAEGPTFGNLTEKRVKEFQQDHGLKAHGIVDEPTTNALNDAHSHTEFRKGDYHPTVIEIKRQLNILGFDGLALSGNFASFTETRVKEFQAYYGLSVTGIADQQTQEKLSEVYDSPYQNGRSHDYTTEIKVMLNALGYNGLAEGPVYGNLTEKRVKNFQSDYGLQVHGIADDPTIEALTNAYDSLQNEFKPGDEHAMVTEIKIKLNRLGFSGLAEGPVYGSLTETRVKEFQEYYGISGTGIADEQTQNKLNEIYDSPYQNGRSSSYMTEVKKKLNGLGYDGLAKGPVFGSLTEKRVKEFQRDHSLKAHGIVDEPTITALNDAYNQTEFQKGDHHPTVIEIKQQLNRLGFDGLALTGNYGNFTETRVKQFQSYYGLSSTGVADLETQEKIDEVYNSPYQNGESNSYTIEIKQMLNAIGYNGLAEGPVYGNLTGKRIKEFQRDHELVINGIADEITMKKLKEVYESRITYHNSRLTLDEALNIQMAIPNPPPQTDKYRNLPAYVSDTYISTTIYQESNVNVRTKPRLVNSTRKHTLSPGTGIEILNVVAGDSYQGSTKWYEIGYNDEVLYVHANLVDATVSIPNRSAVLNVRSERSTSSHVYGTLNHGTSVNITGKNGVWYQISFDSWRNATRADTKAYVDSTKNDRFQHLDLSAYAGATAAELNNYLKGKGILEGMGAAFIEASKTHHINEIYLVSHALLETGNGTSNLATGINVKGNTVYNMFGIGAADSNPNKLGSERAFEEEWFSPYEAIVGGAKFIGERYIHNDQQQNTLYKMRWNPTAMEETGKFGRQYATDIGWATKQTSNLRNMHETIINNPVLKFNIVQYRS